MTTADGRPTEMARPERIEVILVLVLVLLIAFVVWMSHTHNDSLASKGCDFIYGDLGALWGLAQASRPSRVAA